MRSEWPHIRIGDLVAAGDASLQTGPFGSQLHKHDYVERGVAIVPTEAIGRGSIRSDAVLPQVSAAKASELRRHKLRQGDILFARRGVQATGLSAVVDHEHEGALCGTGAILLRVSKEVMDPRFLAAVLATDDSYKWLRAHAVGAVMPNLNTGVISQLTVPRPPLHEQHAIASTVQSLSRRIDLLRQTNATLESIAQALFQSWFIDFDPVRAKAEGREPEGMDAATAALFPAEFEKSALGSIPKGWSVARLGEILELAYGKALKSTERRPGCVPVYGSGGVTGFHDEALVNEPSVIVGRKGTVGALYWEDRPFFPIDTTFYVKPRTAPLTFCFYAMQRLGLENMNTDAAVPGLNRENAYRLDLVKPTDDVLEKFDLFVRALRNGIRANAQRSETLTDLRDSLLPRLVSGKLRLPAAHAEIEEAIA